MTLLRLLDDAKEMAWDLRNESPQVAELLTRLRDELVELDERIRGSEIYEYEAGEYLADAQDRADDIIEKANDEADRIIEEAEKKAKEIETVKCTTNAL